MYGRIAPIDDYVHNELMKKGVTRQLLWSEYKEAHPNGINYTQFCHKYLTWCALRKMSMHQIHKAGEKAFVDWAGLTGEVIDQETGEIRDVYYFVAALGASDFLFTEVYPDMS
jgi:transposase